MSEALSNITELAEWPMISVVVPVRNEEKFIARTVEYILNQDYPLDKLEVIVVDGQSDDRTAEIVAGMADHDNRIKPLNNAARISSAARNIGAQAARGDIITFIDGHVYIDNDMILRNTALFMHEKNVETLSRPQFLDTPDNNFFQRAVSLARKSSFGHGLDSTIYSDEDKYVDPTSSGASYKREVFEKVGYFDEDFDAAEDVEFNYRVGKAGYHSFTSLKLAVYYYPRDSLQGLFKQLTRYGIGRYRFMKKHREAISSGALIPPLFFAALAVLLVLSLIIPPFRPLLRFILGLYLLGNILSSAWIAFRHGFEYLFVLPPIYICIHAGLAWGFLSEAYKTWRESR